MHGSAPPRPASLRRGALVTATLTFVFCAGLTPDDASCGSQDTAGACVRTTPVPKPQRDAPAALQNVLGAPLVSCSLQPLTGWFRDGYCRTDDQDRGVHVVCAQVDAKFLAFTASKGNDLRRPRGTFPGLAPGDRWCLCASRWAEARAAGVAPPVILEATQQKALKLVPMRHLARARVASSAAAPAPRR